MTLDLQHDQLSTDGRTTVEAHSIAGDPEVIRWLGKGRCEQVQQALRDSGVEWTSCDRGRLRVGQIDASVGLEVDETLCVRGVTSQPGDLRALLERSAGFSGNVRFAASGGGVRLAAETRIDGVAHLPRSLAEISGTFARAVSSSSDSELPEPATDGKHAERVSAAIRAAGWSEDDAVETAEGWEIRPRLEGSRIAVQVSEDAAGLRLRKVLIRELPNGTCGQAVAHQALACNEQLRNSRLVMAGNQLVVECRLRAELIDGEWLPFAARAVAAAGRSLEPTLRTLADEQRVADAYCVILLPPRRRARGKAGRKQKKSKSN